MNTEDRVQQQIAAARRRREYRRQQRAEFAQNRAYGLAARRRAKLGNLTGSRKQADQKVSPGSQENPGVEDES